MANARCLRCPICLTNWPLDMEKYNPCPIDGEPTRPGRDEPLNEKEAHSIVSHVLFDRYLEETGRR